MEVLISQHTGNICHKNHRNIILSSTTNRITASGIITYKVNDMNDRELLELAAKAAGLDIKYKDDIRTSIIGKFGIVEHKRRDVFFVECKEWNPLIDDGDALRLSSLLSIDILHRYVGGQRVEAIAPSGSLIVEMCDFETRNKSARIAIVKSAAEIGKGMK